MAVRESYNRTGCEPRQMLHESVGRLEEVVEEDADLSELDGVEVRDGGRVEFVLDQFPVLAESGAVLKIGDDVVPAHPAVR